MTLYQFLPPATLLATYLFLFVRVTTTIQVTWHVPAVFSLVFAAFSLFAVVQDGLLMFWTNHTANGIGNQVWIDVVMAVSMSMIFLVPKAKALKMRVGPWAVFVGITASIGLFAMLARVMYLEERGLALDVADV